MTTTFQNNPTARQFRELLERPGIVRSLGVHDVFTALIAQQEGLETVFIGGFGTAASRLGMPDLNLLTLTEMAEAVRRMATRLHIPVVADGDTGHGGPANVVRTVQEFESAGASGILIEDQVFPKRCGHFQGKQVIPLEEMAAKIRLAVRARSNPDFVIIARTDARQRNGFQDAVERARACGEAGADCLFIEAPESLEELQAIPGLLNKPVLANMLTGGVTPVVSIGELERMGYKIAVYPVESLMVTCTAVRRLARAALAEGRLDSLEGEMESFEGLKALLGLKEFLELQDGA